MELHPTRARLGVVLVADDLPVEEGRRDVDALGHAAESLRVALGTGRDHDVARGEAAVAGAPQADALHRVVAGEQVVLEEIQRRAGLRRQLRGRLPEQGDQRQHAYEAHASSAHSGGTAVGVL